MYYLNFLRLSKSTAVWNKEKEMHKKMRETKTTLTIKWQKRNVD